MADRLDITGFHNGEDVQFSMLMKERNDTDLASPESATVTLTLFAAPGDTTALYTFTQDDSEIAQSGSSSTFDFDVPASSVPNLRAGHRYWYRLTTEVSSVLRQRQGWLTLRM